VLGLLATRPAWGVVALPLLARLYVRAKDLPGIDPEHRPEFRTELVLAVELLRGAKTWLGLLGKPLWIVADGAYAKADFLKPAKSPGMTVVSRLRKDSGLYTVPGPQDALAGHLVLLSNRRRDRPRILMPERRVFHDLEETVSLDRHLRASRLWPVRHDSQCPP